VFLSFGENLEGLIHISELAWQRIDDPSDLFKVGDKIKAEIISIEGSKIFLSAKKLLTDPWQEVDRKYQVGQKVSGTILKINPFGLFVELDKDIHGLAHISQLGLPAGRKINEVYKIGERQDLTVVSLEPKDHRLGLAVAAKVEAAAETKVEVETEAEKKPKTPLRPRSEASKKTKSVKAKDKPEKKKKEK